MRFQITTDYAIRIILFMAGQEEKLITAKKTASEVGLTYPYFNKVITKLMTAGFVESVQGKNGGYRLVKKAADISIYNIIEEMEGAIHINRCTEKDGYCSRNATHICQVHNIFAFLQNQIIYTLDSVKISDLISGTSVWESGIK